MVNNIIIPHSFVFIFWLNYSLCKAFVYSTYIEYFHMDIFITFLKFHNLFNDVNITSNVCEKFLLLNCKAKISLLTTMRYINH